MLLVLPLLTVPLVVIATLTARRVASGASSAASGNQAFEHHLEPRARYLTWEPARATTAEPVSPRLDGDGVTLAALPEHFVVLKHRGHRRGALRRSGQSLGVTSKLVLAPAHGSPSAAAGRPNGSPQPPTKGST
jgi:hypothetical protein